MTGTAERVTHLLRYLQVGGLRELQFFYRYNIYTGSTD